MEHAVGAGARDAGRASGGRRGRIVHVHVAPLHFDEIVIVDGIAVTSIARTLVDIARTVPFEQAVVVLDAALARGLVDGPRSRRRCCASSGGAAPRRRGGRSRSPSRAPRASASHAAGWRSCARACPGRCCSGRSATGPATSSAAPTSAGPRWAPSASSTARSSTAGCLRPGQSPGEVVFAEKVREDRIRATDLGMARWVWDELGPAFAPVAARIRAQFRGSHTPRGAHTHRGQYV